MNPILKNFLRVIRHYKLAVALNILGLSIAFAAFMVIMTQVHYDYSFDRFHKDYDKIFRLEKTSWTKEDGVSTTFARPFANQFIESSPYILDGAITSFNKVPCRFHVETDGARNYYEGEQLVVSPSFFDMFTFEFVEGSKSFAPRQVIIPLSLSRKLFGNEPAVGQQIVHSNWGNQTVAAVYRDFPANSSIGNFLYFAFGETENIQDWSNWSYRIFIRVNDPSNLSAILDNFKRNFEPPEDKNNYNWEETVLRFTALPDLHFLADLQIWENDKQKANKQTLAILFAIAMVIIAIAGINFTNFSIAMAPKRIKAINTQRIFGADKRLMMVSIVFEAVLLSLLSCLIALIFYTWFLGSSLATLVDAVSMSRPLIFGGVALMALLVGLFAGLYPARYMTSFAPALAIKGSFGATPGGKKLRNTLTSVQFIASFVLIIAASFIYLQNRFMQKSPLGYDKDELITVDTERIWKHHDAFTNQLKAYPGVEDVTYGRFLLANSDESYMGWGRDYKDEEIFFNVLPVNYKFLKTIGVKITEGRDFSEEDENLPTGALIFNETARRSFNLELGTKISNCEIIGFMPDLKFASFRKAVEPMAFGVGKGTMGGSMSCAYIKVKAGANKRDVMSHIHATLDEIAPANPYPSEVLFFDEVMQRLYEKEIALNTLITLFSLIAIFISIVGVFGLIVFDGEYRRKEVGIRKVLGATTMSIIVMFNKAYIKILLISFVVAAPLAYYAVHRWLENFAYKTPMYWWVYLLAFVVVGAITVATVTFQNWRVANDDPVNSIKKD